MRKAQSAFPWAALAVAVGWAGAGVARGAGVFGTVIENPTFQPLAGAWVQLVGKEVLPDSQRTDSAGGFRFDDVSGCGQFECGVRVRKEGFWLFESPYFVLRADEVKEVPVELERIHFLTVSAAAAEDSGGVPEGSLAVLVSESGTRTAAAMDSSGRAEFPDLYSFLAYRLTVAAPGRLSQTFTLHFHGSNSRDFYRAVLEKDGGGISKSLQGTLSAGQRGPAAGEDMYLGCLTGTAANLFARTAADGHYAFTGVPPDCDSAMLYAGKDSLAISLPEKSTSLDWAAEFPVPTGTARRPSARPLPAGRWQRLFDALGRKLSAARERFRP